MDAVHAAVVTSRSASAALRDPIFPVEPASPVPVAAPLVSLLQLASNAILAMS